MPPQPQPRISDLLSKAVGDAQRLATAQVALVKTEMSASGQKIGMGSGLVIAAVSLIAMAGLFLLVTLALGLAQLGLQPWAAFLIVALLLIIGAVVAGLLARRSFSEVSPPSIAMAEFEKTKAALTGAPVVVTPPIVGQ